MSTPERTESTRSRSSSIRSKNPQPRRKTIEGECDFFESPTVLSRLILHQKYESAARRIKKAPHEVSTWVSKNRLIEEVDEPSPSSVMALHTEKRPRVECSYRQLPLHMACSALSRVVDKGLRVQVETLIRQLVVAYPEACARRDHENRLPLHEALWQNASPDTIITILMAYPDATTEKDIYGRSTLELNKHRRGDYKEEVGQMLSKSKAFWEFARQEAKLKLKQASCPSAGETIKSTSPLSDSLCGEDDYTIMTRESVFQGRAPEEYRERLRRSGPIDTKKATKWSQLEERALQLEKLLADRHEENFNMAQEISRLKEVEEKYEKVTSSKYLAQTLVKLEKEKGEMEKQITKMRKVLQRNGLSADDASLYSKPLEVNVEVMSPNGFQRKRSIPKNIPSTVSIMTEDDDEFPTREEYVEEVSSSSASQSGDSVTGSTTSSSSKDRSSPASSSAGSMDCSSNASKGSRSSDSSLGSKDGDKEELELDSSGRHKNSSSEEGKESHGSSDDKRVVASAEKGQGSGETSGSSDSNLSNLSRKDLERLEKEQAVVDRLRDERKYLQSLIDQLSQSRKWRGKTSRYPSKRRMNKSPRRVSQRLPPKDVPTNITLDGEGSISKTTPLGSSGRSSSRSYSKSKSRTSKSTDLLDYSKRISGQKSASVSSQRSSRSGGSGRYKGSSASRRMLEEYERSSSSEDSVVGGDLDPIVEEASDCSGSEKRSDRGSVEKDHRVEVKLMERAQVDLDGLDGYRPKSTRTSRGSVKKRDHVSSENTLASF